MDDTQISSFFKNYQVPGVTVLYFLKPKAQDDGSSL